MNGVARRREPGLPASGRGGHTERKGRGAVELVYYDVITYPSIVQKEKKGSCSVLNFDDGIREARYCLHHLQNHFYDLEGKEWKALGGTNWRRRGSF